MTQALEYSHLGGSWEVCASNPLSFCIRPAHRMLVTRAVRAKGLPRLWKRPQGQRGGTSVSGPGRCAGKLRSERGSSQHQLHWACLGLASRPG